MTRGEAIERLCKLVDKVGNQEFHNEHAHDCICEGKEQHPLVKTVIDEEVILFIEAAVDSALVESGIDNINCLRP